ncbi:MAG: hypothetical protein QM346_11740 [Chloroflexota bacterium]|nr:hypothetical protein [Chloroflexota bacterium]
MQLALFTGYYRCHNCEREMEHVQRTRRFWLCDACWAAIMPAWEQVEVVRNGRKRDRAWYAETAEQRSRIAAYWEWYGDMEKRRPARSNGHRRYVSWGRQALRERAALWDADAYWPLCACGNRRQEMATLAGPPGLFGGPFRALCPTCEAKAQLKTILDMASRIHPEWDDEDWLDALSQSHPHLFDLGVLPDGWYKRIDSQPDIAACTEQRLLSHGWA